MNGHQPPPVLFTPEIAARQARQERALACVAEFLRQAGLPGGTPIEAIAALVQLTIEQRQRIELLEAKVGEGPSKLVLPTPQETKLVTG